MNPDTLYTLYEDCSDTNSHHALLLPMPTLFISINALSPILRTLAL